MNADVPPPYLPPPVPPFAPAAEAPDGPAAAGLGRRALAWSIDFALVIGVAVALGSWTWTRISAELTSVPALAEKSAWRLLSSRGDVKGASVDFGLSIWNTAVGYVVQAFAALALIVFVYHFASLAWKGRTLGKLVLDLRVEGHRRPRLGKGQALGRAAAATVADIGLYALACCLLLQGAFVLSVTCWVLAVAVFWANVLPVLFPGRRTLHDRVLGTQVARAHLYLAAASQAVQGGRLALHGAQQGVQQLRASDSAQRVQELGRDTAGKGRMALGKAKQAYADRHGSTPAPPPAIAPPQPHFSVQPPPVPYQPDQQAQPPYQQAQQPYQQIPRPEDQ